MNHTPKLFNDEFSAKDITYNLKTSPEILFEKRYDQAKLVRSPSHSQTCVNTEQKPSLLCSDSNNLERVILLKFTVQFSPSAKTYLRRELSRQKIHAVNESCGKTLHGETDYGKTSFGGIELGKICRGETSRGEALLYTVKLPSLKFWVSGEYVFRTLKSCIIKKLITILKLKARIRMKLPVLMWM